MSDVAAQNQEGTKSPVRWPWVAVVVASCCAAAVATVCYFMGDWPWNFDWLDGNQPDTVLLSVVEELQIPLILIGFAGFFTSVWVLLRNGGIQPVTRGRSIDEVVALAQPEELVREVSALVAENGVDVLLSSEDVPSRSDCPQSDAAVVNLETENRELKEQIAKANIANSSFLSSVSHELRTPMNGIVGMSELLQASKLASLEGGYANAIHASANSLMYSLNDILDYTRLSNGELELEKSCFNLPECIEDMCEMLAVSAHQRGNELICDVDIDVPVMVDGDANRIRQVLNHLISNAIACTEEGEVVVRLVVDKKRDKMHTLRCTVSDTGTGILPENQIGMLEAFAQADKPITKGHESLGLGLAVSRELVSAMKGEMNFTSRVDEGTTFIFTMDLCAAAGETTTNKQPMMHGTKVLLVDDNDTSRNYLNHQLSLWGVVTVNAASAAEATDALRLAESNGHGFDAMIVDMHMPEMDGVTLIRTLYEDESYPMLRSLLLTSAVIDETTETLKKIGIEKILSKPVRQNVLQSSLLSLVPSAHKRDATELKAVAERPNYSPVEASVLLVEGDKVNREVIAGLLESFGCKVEVTSDGEKAISLCERYDYDIVFMDLESPIISGFEATEAIRALSSSRSSVCIVALGALAMAGGCEKCKASGMNDYLSKPLNQDQLYASVNRWCVGKCGDETGAATEAKVHSSRELEEPVQAKPTASQSHELFEVVNPAALEAIRRLQPEGKQDLLQKVLALYFEKSPVLVDQIVLAQGNGHLAELSAAAHALKSSSAYVGAEQLVSLCKQLEQGVFDKNDELLADVASKLPDAYQRVEAALRNTGEDSAAA